MDDEPRRDLMPEGPADSGSFNVAQAIPGVITQPVPTMQAIAAARPWPIALAYYIGIAVISGVAGAFSAQAQLASLQAQLGSLDPEARQQFEAIVRTFLNPVALVGSSVVLAPIALVIVAGILWLVARLLGGQGPFSGLFSTLAFAATPSLFQSVLTIPLSLAGAAFSSLVSLIAFAIGIWSLVLQVIGIRESMNLSTGRAVATVLIPIGVLVVLCCVLAVAFGALIAGIIANAAGGG
jgi:hypothetical protein